MSGSRISHHRLVTHPVCKHLVEQLCPVEFVVLVDNVRQDLIGRGQCRFAPWPSNETKIELCSKVPLHTTATYGILFDECMASNINMC